MQQTPVAGYGRYNQITIVRHDGSRPQDRFYTLVDRNSHQIGRTWRYLRNARNQATALARHLSGDTTALTVMGVNADGLTLYHRKAA